MNDTVRKRRPEARPQEILAAALTLFSERGFAATRLEDVAALAGLSKAAIYLYFPDKAALLRAIVEEAVSANLDAVRSVPPVHHGPVAPFIATFLETMASRLNTSQLPDVIKLVIAESRAHPAIGRLYLDANIGRAVPILQSLIERGIVRGEFRSVDPALTARCIVGPMVLGALWRSVFEPIGGEPLDIAALARQHADLILNGLLPRPPGSQAPARSGARG